MALSPPNTPGGSADDPREIAKWARRYAKSRTIPFLVQWVLIVLLGVIIAATAYLAMRAWAYRTENFAWFLLCAGCAVAMVIALAWFMAPQWGGDLVYRISQWVYGDEGYADDIREDMAGPRWIYILGAGLAVWHLAGAVLIVTRHLPLQYLQPFSALYMVPFFVVMAISQRLGFWAFIWPLLYGFHTVLILAEVPVRFTDVNLVILNIIVPIFGYGLVAILVGHVYSRYALYRLKALARKGLDAAAAAEDADALEE